MGKIQNRVREHPAFIFSLICPNLGRIGGGRIKKTFRDAAPVWTAFSLVVVWLGAAAAGAYTAGINLIDFMGAFSKAMESPFSLRWTAQTIPFMLGALAVYACAIFMYYSTRETSALARNTAAPAGAASGN